MGTPWPSEFYPSRKVCGYEIEKFDSFHEYIFHDESNKIAAGGTTGSFLAGITIGLPPIIHFGNEEQRKKYVTPCLTGQKRICLAITEPWGGSDVANLKTSAKKSECGKYYIVNGMKKWISNALYSDYFTTAVRTGDDGMFGVSLLIIERNSPGVSTRKMKVMGGPSGGTTFISFFNVKVPVENLIGEENEGFKYIMMNFNHERLVICMGAVSAVRVLVEESLIHAHRRETFGKKLIEHPVIRYKLGNMVRSVETC
eukprot:TRINITY_DN66905_c0_g1_i1.p1 TRINITY_DN66905_c0_g1~~TRINITY_DN66905_c0_g1_i1.p1  ORF type:complete len:256 (-),score=-39.47 TRINITY_DN66905_c0_g1_i1:358-1125(-)